METGYKAFRSEILRSLGCAEDDFAIEPEITAKICLRNAARVRAADLVLRPHLRRGQEHHLARRLPRGLRALPDAPAAVVMADEEALWDLSAPRPGARALRLDVRAVLRVRPRRTVEVGAGIGTFSERLLAHGVRELMLLEPEAVRVAQLRARFGSNPRVTVVDELLPEAPSLLAWEGTADFVLCQNVLEHIAEESGAVKAMADALAPGGVVTILVPAHPRLYGRLDERYGHERRYTRKRLARVIHRTGLELVDLYSFNALGIPGVAGEVVRWEAVGEPVAARL